MYLKGLSRSYERGPTRRSSGMYLVLMRPEGNREAPVKALVRYVELAQRGPHMQGELSIRVEGERYTAVVSGAYGGEGSPCAVPWAIYDLGEDVPEDLLADCLLRGGQAAMDAWARTLTGSAWKSHKTINWEKTA